MTDGRGLRCGFSGQKLRKSKDKRIKVKLI
jgi:hypothetical protein